MTHLLIDTASERSVYVQIMDQVRARVREGTLVPGAALPSVRQLAADLEVNPNTVAKAYTLLESEGVLITRSRRGTFVAPSAPQRATESGARRLDEAVDRFLGEASHLVADREDLVEVLRRRIRAGARPARGGGSP